MDPRVTETHQPCPQEVQVIDNHLAYEFKEAWDRLRGHRHLKKAIQAGTNLFAETEESQFRASLLQQVDPRTYLLHTDRMGDDESTTMALMLSARAIRLCSVVPLETNVHAHEASQRVNRALVLGRCGLDLICQNYSQPGQKRYFVPRILKGQVGLVTQTNN